MISLRERPHDRTAGESRPQPNNLHYGAWIIMVCALLSMDGCALFGRPWKTPEVTLLALQPKQIGLRQQSFIVIARVSNPNDRTLPINAISYRLSLEGDELINGSTELEHEIPALSEEVIELEVNSNFLELISRVPMLALSTDDLRWKMTGTLSVAGGAVKLPYRYSGKINPEKLIPGTIP